MNITLSLAKNDIELFNRAYSKYINQSTARGEPVYSRSKFMINIISDWYAKQNLNEAIKKDVIK